MTLFFMVMNVIAAAVKLSIAYVNSTCTLIMLPVRENNSFILVMKVLWDVSKLVSNICDI